MNAREGPAKRAGPLDPPSWPQRAACRRAHRAVATARLRGTWARGVTGAGCGGVAAMPTVRLGFRACWAAVTAPAEPPDHAYARVQANWAMGAKAAAPVAACGGPGARAGVGEWAAHGAVAAVMMWAGSCLGQAESLALVSRCAGSPERSFMGESRAWARAADTGRHVLHDTHVRAQHRSRTHALRTSTSTLT
jgi:hypothetical protein